ncbi:MAG: CcmD family protein [Dehalococcoidia bacterium]|nr:CcmD family protein [Dehalococcoidia bacterium]
MDEKLLYLFAAYTIIWAALLIYNMSISRRQKELQREIDALREAINAKETVPRQ